jgi:hypothetical protein
LVRFFYEKGGVHHEESWGSSLQLVNGQQLENKYTVNLWYSTKIPAFAGSGYVPSIAFNSNKLERKGFKTFWFFSIDYPLNH